MGRVGGGSASQPIVSVMPASMAKPAELIGTAAPAAAEA
jgi:hypothetical protein